MAQKSRAFIPSAQPLPAARMAARGIRIEPIRFSELREVAGLQRRAFRPPLAYGLTTLLVLWLLPHVKFIVARDRTQIVGCAIGDRHGGQSRVINICVDPYERNKGIGGRLLRALEAALPIGDVLLMVEADNDSAKSLYRREGYTEVGISRSYYGRGKDGLWMQKHRTVNSPRKIRV
jgi:ribosomal protein S18 acetylase RimI-like enzyme